MISRPVKTLVVARGQVAQRGQRLATSQNPLSQIGVKPRSFPLSGGQRSRLVPDAVLDPDTPDVVDQAGPPEIPTLGLTQAGHPGGSADQFGHSR